MKYCTQLLAVLLTWGTIVHAQDQLQVIEKVIEKKIPVTKEIKSIKVNGEKANISIQTWKKNEVFVSIKLIAKNKDRSIGEKEMKYMKYSAEASGLSIKISNFLAIDPNVNEITSSLSFEYVIYMPESLTLHVTNYFGNTAITGIHNKIKCKLEFGNLTLKDITASINIDIEYGSIYASQISAMVDVFARHTDITLLNTRSGEYYFNSRYGSIAFMSQSSFDKLVIDANGTDITINPNCKEYGLDILSTFGEVFIANANCDMQVEEINPNEKSVRHTTPGLKQPVTIKATHGTIRIIN